MTISPQVPHRGNYAQRECSSCPSLELNSLRREAENLHRGSPTLKWWASPCLGYQDWGSEESGVWCKALDCHRAYFNLDLLLWFVLQENACNGARKAEERGHAQLPCHEIKWGLKQRHEGRLFHTLNVMHMLSCQYFSKNLKGDFPLGHLRGWDIFPLLCGESSFKNLCRVEIGLEAGGHLEHGRRERALGQRKAVRGGASHREAPWVEVRDWAWGLGWESEREQEVVRTDRC